MTSAAPADTEAPAKESARAKRARIKAERDAAVEEALGRGLSAEEAERAADETMRARARAEAIDRAAQAQAAAGLLAAEPTAVPGQSTTQPTTQSTSEPASQPASQTTLESPGAAAKGGSAAPVSPVAREKAAAKAMRQADGIPSIKAPRENRAPAARAPTARESGPTEAVLGRFLNPSKAPARIGNLIYLVGLFNIATAIFRPWRARLAEVAEYVPGSVETVGFATVYSILSGIFLIMVAHSVKRGKVRGWWTALVLIAGSIILRVLDEYFLRTPIASALAILGLVLLLVYRKQFTASSDPTTRWRALWVFLGLLVSTLFIGTWFVSSNSKGLFGETRLPFIDSLSVALSGMLGDNLSQYALTPSPLIRVFSWVLMGLGLVTILVPLYLFLRSARQTSTIDAADDDRIRSLLDAHPDSLGYFNTRKDKEIVWSESGKSGIAYRVVSGVMLASGDPLGDPEAWPGAISAFLEEAARHGWAPGVLGCSELAGTVWVRETGFQALELGDEAIVDTRAFSLDGRQMRNVRQMVNRIRRLGYDTEMMRVKDTPAPWREKALRDADAWRVGATERGFSMATSRVFDAERDPEAVVVVATKDGVIEGMLQFAPWGPDGMSLDLMRRNQAADPGINELLIVDALSKAPALGIHRVSLNFAMFRSTFERGEKLGAGPVLKTWRKMLVIGNTWFQLESLYKFNAKFQPVWFPRFVIYPRVADFLRVSVAAGQAEAFIVFPRLTLPFRGGR